MEISDIRIRKLYSKGKMRAVVSVTLGGDTAVHDIKVIQGEDRLFVAMPSRRDENGVFRDIVHPITEEAREILEQNILAEYIRYTEDKES